MKRTNKKKLITALSPLAILLILAGVIGFFWLRNIILVRNSSGMTIDEFSLIVCARNYTLTDVPDGETGTLCFWVTGDSNFQMSAKLEDGTVLSNSFGYVTGGTGAYHNRATITVRSNVIEGHQ